MVVRHIDHKVSNGKLLRIDWALDNGKISYIRITGDFFIYPEEGITAIEDALIGKAVLESASVVNDAINKSNLKVIGFEASDIQYALSKSEDIR